VIHIYKSPDFPVSILFVSRVALVTNNHHTVSRLHTSCYLHVMYSLGSGSRLESYWHWRDDWWSDHLSGDVSGVSYTTASVWRHAGSIRMMCWCWRQFLWQC